MNPHLLRLLPAVAVLAPALANASIQDIPRTDQTISIDGTMNDGEWADATQVEVNIETRPGENIEAKVKTIAYLVEDGESLFVAFDAQDPNPGAIRAFLRDRDSAFDDEADRLRDR